MMVILVVVLAAMGIFSAMFTSTSPILAISMSVSMELQTAALGGQIIIEIHPFS